MIKKIIGSLLAATLFIVIGFKVWARETGAVDLVVFSYDRPLQLYAFLESTNKYITGIETISVIYRATDDDYVQGYEKVHNQFPSVTFIKQSYNPYQDFKPLLMQASFESPTPYIVYGVDDIVVTDYVDMHQVVAALKKTGAFGFFLRMGLNLQESYMNHSAPQRIPPLTQIEPDIFAWNFSQGEFDWAYPTSQDMTVYPKKEIDFLLKQIPFHSPNSCEAQWYGCADYSKKQGLCFSSAKIVNIPMNMVQAVRPNNRNMNLFSPKDLLAKFNEGLKMDINPLSQAKFNSVHVEYVPTFVKRA